MKASICVSLHWPKVVRESITFCELIGLVEVEARAVSPSAPKLTVAPDLESSCPV